MNEFEFLRDLPIGQYIPQDSLVHRLDPRARILAFTLLILALTFTPHTVGLVLGLAAGGAGWGLARLHPGPAIKGWRTALPFLVFLAILQVIFNVGPDTGAVVLQTSWITITSHDVMAGVNLIIRFSAFITILGLASSVLSASDITRGSEALLRPLKRLGFPAHDFVMVVQVTLRFFPLLAQTAERIAKAQASRGADWNARGNIIARARRTAPLLVPLFVVSLRRAENLALAMDARAYGSGPDRSSMVELRFTRTDWMALALVCAASGLILLGLPRLG